MIRTQISADSHPQQGKQPPAAPQLLVSVRDASEAALAKSLGVEWIDLKNPDIGPLGAATSRVAQDVAAALRLHSNCPVRVASAAAGELRDAPLQAAQALAPLFPLVKVGLSGLAGDPHWRTQFYELAQLLYSLGSQIVPVIYADHGVCQAPAPEEVLSATIKLDAINLRPSISRYLLIDTFTKDGKRLFDWLDETQIAAICQQAQTLGRQTVLAGSLAVPDLPKLLKLPTAAIAVRGAVCSHDRRSGLCPTKVTQWLQLVQNR